MAEPRSIWLKLKDSIPQGFVWALVEHYADIPEEEARGGSDWGSACGKNELAADGWSAVKTNYRRVPVELRDLTGAVVDVQTRKLTCVGCEFDLRDEGLSRGRGREPDAPAGFVVDEVAYNAWKSRSGGPR